jgi:hypothetical protein
LGCRHDGDVEDLTCFQDLLGCRED